MRFNRYSQGFPRGGLRIGPGGISPFIKWIIIINVAVFILELIFKQMIPLFGLTPALFFSEFPNLIYQPFTYMFLHGGFMHILFNMFFLWMFGTEIEYTWGTKRFGKFYIMAGLSGAIMSFIIFPNQAIPIIGASGAIYGVLVAYWFMFPQRYLYLYFLVPIKVKYAIPGMMVLVFLFGGANIAHMAHLGGAVFGLIYMKADWRMGGFFSKFKNLHNKQKEAKLNKNRQEAEEIMKKVDAILDKINEVGFENLSKAERKFLEDASSELTRRHNDKTKT